jgi:hypothetical protein
MGCGNELSESDDKAVEESINGENCEPAPNLSPHPSLPSEDFAERIAREELGLSKEELGNRELVEERIRQHAVRTWAEEDRIALDLLSEEVYEKAIEYKTSDEKDKEEAQKIGERINEIYRELAGYEPLLKSSQKTIPQSFDSVWWDSIKNQVVISEEKTFGSRCNYTRYGKQGTIMWAYGAAEYLLKSQKATRMEKEVAEKIKIELERGNVRVEIVRVNEKGLKIESKQEVIKFNEE